MTCGCAQDRPGATCTGKVFGQMAIRGYSDLLNLELAGAGGCPGGVSYGQGTNRSFYVPISGGAGGDGGGGLVLSGTQVELTEGCLDTSGTDGSPGDFLVIDDGEGGNSLTVHGGAGSGGNPGRILVVIDGGLVTNTSGGRFVDSVRGVTPTAVGGCQSRYLGSDNANRSENVFQSTQLGCPGGR